MLDPDDLYELDPQLAGLTGPTGMRELTDHVGLPAGSASGDDRATTAGREPSGATDTSRPVLLLAVPGLVDAGSAVQQSAAHLLDTLEHRVVARFDVDQLHDYRARRPPMVFAADHWEDYEAPTLDLHLLRDGAGRPFLLLTGPEPDVQWERFAAAVRSLVERFDVRLTVALNAIPMGVPHTRPIGLTAHATRPELVRRWPAWIGTVQVPGSAAALLEHRLGQAGHDAMGFAAHVPHYLTQAQYPDAAQALLDAVQLATGLTLPTDALQRAAEVVRGEVEQEVGRSEEVAAVVAALEQQYDAYAGARARTTLLAPGGEELPTADELGAELERFLAEHGGDEGSGT